MRGSPTATTDFPGLAAQAVPPPQRGPSQSERTRRETQERRIYVRGRAAIALVRHGLGGMSLHALARTMDLSASSLAYLYGTRDELLGDIVAEHLSGLTHAVCAAFDGAGDASPAVRLSAMLLALLDGIAADPHAHAVAVHGALGLTLRDREAAAVRWQVLLSTLAEPLGAASPALAARPGLARAMVQCVVGGCGDALAGFAGEDGMDRAAQAQRLAGMLLAGAGAERDGRGPAGGCGGPSVACAQAWLMAAAGGTAPGDAARTAAGEAGSEDQA